MMFIEKKRRKWLVLASLLLLMVGAGIWYRYKVPKFVNGDTAADFTAQMADGSTAKLSDLRGKYVLLHFWGSWCGPCRRENPFLVELYRKHHEKGFEIFSVAIEQNADRWKNAMVKDGMVWPYHTAEIGEFDGPIAKQYFVWQIPSTWLINPEGVIVGVNLPPEKIDKVLSDNLK